MTRYASFGSVSTGTLRPEDLLVAFADELDYQLGRQVTRFPRKEYRKLIREARRHSANSVISVANADEVMLAIANYDETSEDIVNELIDALNEFAPPYAYFGAHSGDGADFGYWLTDDLAFAFDGLKVSDTCEVPRDYSGEVLHVNDHGNVTLYAARNGKLREIWAVV